MTLVLALTAAQALAGPPVIGLAEPSAAGLLCVAIPGPPLDEGSAITLVRVDAPQRATVVVVERAAAVCDPLKRAMIAVDQVCTGDYGARLIMQVHDELVLEVRADRVEEVSDMVRARMMGAADLRVPLKVDVGTGANWDEAH